MTDITAEKILNLATKHATLPQDVVQEWLHLSSARVRFLKSLPMKSSVLDIGAGDGSLTIFRDWPMPKRNDLKLFAVSLKEGMHFNKYDGYEVKNIDKDELFVGKTFDAAFSVNCAEHINGGIYRMADICAQKVKYGGLIFIEMPSPKMKTLPRMKEFLMKGLQVSTTNFFDDSTHKNTVDLPEMRAAIEQAGFLVEESGVVRNRYLEDQMLALGNKLNDVFLSTMAIWMLYGVQQYVVAERV